MYKINFPNIPNMGDLLNQDMLEELFGVEIVRSNSVFDSNMSAIGSGLTTLQKSSLVHRRIKQMVNKSKTEQKHYIWGSGFIEYPSNYDRGFIYDNIEVVSLRGKLTKNRMEKILDKILDVPLGDGGLLAECWVGKVEKKYAVGIIPHYKEQNHPLIIKLLEEYTNSTCINLCDKPKNVIKNIAECDVILSSSLHGLIVADSYHIPNKHIMLYPFGEKIMGDGFKFADYYSAFDLEDSYINLNIDSAPDINAVIQQYCIQEKQIEEMKENIFRAFPRL